MNIGERMRKYYQASQALNEALKLVREAEGHPGTLNYCAGVHEAIKMDLRARLPFKNIFHVRPNGERVPAMICSTFDHESELSEAVHAAQQTARVGETQIEIEYTDGTRELLTVSGMEKDGEVSSRVHRWPDGGTEPQGPAVTAFSETGPNGDGPRMPG